MFDKDTIDSDIFILSSSYAYKHGCGGEGAGIDVFSSFQEAVQSQLSWLDGFDENEFDADEYDKHKAELEEFSKSLGKNSEDDINPVYLNINGNNIGYATHAAGKWGDFVDDALTVFEADIGTISVEADENGSDEEELTDLEEELLLINDLKQAQDYFSVEYIESFIELASNFEERNC